MDNFDYLKQYRNPTEMLINLYLETKNDDILRRLIDRAGFQILLDLDVAGYKILAYNIFIEQHYNLLTDIKDHRKFKAFGRYVADLLRNNNFNIDEDENYSDSIENLVDGLVSAIGHVNWFNNAGSEVLIKERMNFLFLCLENAKAFSSSSLLKELTDAIAKNVYIPIEVLIPMIQRFPELSISVLKYMYLKTERRSDIFLIVNIIGSVRDALRISESQGQPVNVEKLVTQGIDEFLCDDVVTEIFYDIFISVEPIKSFIINYRKEEFVLFYERVTLFLKDYKDNVDFYIENYGETEGIFPLGPIDQEITSMTIEGLCYILYHGNTLKDFQLVRDDVILMRAIETVENCLELLMMMEIIPTNWTTSDEYYNVISGDNSKYIEDTPDGGFDINAILEGLD